MIEISKSESKRQMHALQKLGEDLTTLKEPLLLSLDLPLELQKAILEDKNITGDKAKRRHRQFIGKLMRRVDEETIVRIKRVL